jgi:hypothetical protein
MRSHSAPADPARAVAAATLRDQQMLVQREALREFMKMHRLAPTVWAKQAGIPASLLLGYLTGTAAQLDPAACEKLARAAGVDASALFAPKEKAAPRPPFRTRIDLD